MNFEFTEEQIMIQQAARDYAQRELIKEVTERDEKAEYQTEHVKNLSELGFMGMLVG
jgi:alkylation response protein AidB-like acyl-CoA dehydrogenase